MPNEQLFSYLAISLIIIALSDMDQAAVLSLDHRLKYEMTLERREIGRFSADQSPEIPPLHPSSPDQFRM
jgi:hypothetical protein